MRMFLKTAAKGRETVKQINMGKREEAQAAERQRDGDRDRDRRRERDTQIQIHSQRTIDSAP